MKASQETGSETNIRFGRALMLSYLGMNPLKLAFLSLLTSLLTQLIQGSPPHFISLGQELF